MNHNNEDWSIVESCLNGNREAYALLVKKYEKSVFNTISLLGRLSQSLNSLIGCSKLLPISVKIG